MTARTNGRRATKPAAIQGIAHEGAIVQVQTLTPDEATVLLDANHHNRRLNAARVSHLAADMRAGLWDFTGDAIRIAVDGQLLDGQHRLAACVESGVPLTTVVISGLPAQAQESMDIGRKRTVADSLTIAGEKNGPQLAAALGFLNRWMTQGMLNNKSRSNPLTPRAALGVLADHPRIREHVGAYTSNRLAQSLAAPGGLSALAYIITRIDRDDAREFLDGVLAGAGLAKGDPRFVVREALVRRYSRYGALSQSGRLNLLLQAWVSFQRREQRAQFRVPASLYSPSGWPDLPGDALRFSKAEELVA